MNLLSGWFEESENNAIAGPMAAGQGQGDVMLCFWKKLELFVD